MCLPLLGLVMGAVMEFGHIRTLELMATTAAYVAAANSAQGLDGAAAATMYLKGNGIESSAPPSGPGRRGSRGSKVVSVAVSRHVSIVNYWEAEVSYTEPSAGLLKAVFPDTFSVTRSCRWYVPRSYLKQGTTWMPTDEEATSSEQ